MGTKTVWLSVLFTMSSFVFSRRKQRIQVWNNISASKWQQNFPFWIDMDENEALSDRLAVFKMAHTV